MVIKMPYKLSASTLQLLKECPRCFWLHFNKGIRRPDSIFPSLPAGMDRQLKLYFDFFMKRNQLPPELRMLKQIKPFNNIELLNQWRNNFAGVKYQDKKGNILRGAVDNLLQFHDKLIVLDFKTRGYPLKDGTANYYQDQMDIYNFLIRKNGYETEDYAYLLFYHPNKINENGEFKFKTDLVKRPINVSNAKALFNRALKVLDNEIPNPTEECGYCRWVKNNNEYEKIEYN